MTEFKVGDLVRFIKNDIPLLKNKIFKIIGFGSEKYDEDRLIFITDSDGAFTFVDKSNIRCIENPQSGDELIIKSRLKMDISRAVDFFHLCIENEDGSFELLKSLPKETIAKFKRY